MLSLGNPNSKEIQLFLFILEISELAFLLCKLINIKIFKFYIFKENVFIVWYLKTSVADPH